jgi:hypothetical protein
MEPLTGPLKGRKRDTTDGTCAIRPPPPSLTIIFEFNRLGRPITRVDADCKIDVANARGRDAEEPRGGVEGEGRIHPPPQEEERAGVERGGGLAEGACAEAAEEARDGGGEADGDDGAAGGKAAGGED